MSESAEFVGIPGTQYSTARGYVSAETFVNRKLEYSVIDGLAVFEGDIIMGPADAMPDVPEVGSEGVAIAGARFRWPNRHILFTLDHALPRPERVRDAIRHWESHTRIRFGPRTTETDFVTFRAGSGCSSGVGRNRGQQFVTLGAECTTDNAIHEIGHTVGLWHEQSRRDRDRHVTIIWSNIRPEFRHNFDQHVTDGLDLGAYDFGSIMHYPRNAFAIDPSRPTSPRPMRSARDKV